MKRNVVKTILLTLLAVLLVYVMVDVWVPIKLAVGLGLLMFASIAIDFSIDKWFSRYEIGYNNKKITSLIAFAFLVGLSMIAMVIQTKRNAEKTGWKEETKAQTVITAMTSSYKEIGWREVLKVDCDKMSELTYVVFSGNDDTNDVSSYRRAYTGGIPSIDSNVLLIKNGKRWAYIVGTEYRNGNGAMELGFVAMNMAPFLRRDKFKE